MGQVPLAIMVTTTTYGTWPPGDLRGYVDHRRLMPSNPRLMKHAVSSMHKDPVLLSENEQSRAFVALLSGAIEFGYQVLAVSLESWHVHLLVTGISDDIAGAIGRLKTRMRQAVNRGRIWTAGYDMRECFDEDELASRHWYIQRHPGWRRLENEPIIANA